MSISEISNDIPLFPNDNGHIRNFMCHVLAGIFYTSKKDFFSKFYTESFPHYLLCYFIPSILSSLGIIADKWMDVSDYHYKALAISLWELGRNQRPKLSESLYNHKSDSNQ